MTGEVAVLDDHVNQVAAETGTDLVLPLPIRKVAVLDIEQIVLVPPAYIF